MNKKDKKYNHTPSSDNLSSPSEGQTPTSNNTSPLTSNTSSLTSNVSSLTSKIPHLTSNVSSLTSPTSPPSEGLGEVFIRTHAQCDVHQLALQADRYPDIDMPFALDQIAGRQTAQVKLPTWAETEGIIYPPHLSLEQCSSEQTARYKARLAWQLAAIGQDEKADMPQGEAHMSETKTTSFIDLTGGFGVDFSFMAERFASCTYIEQQELLCSIATHNFPLLGLERAKVIHGNGVEQLREMKPVDIIFIDPARRNENGGKTVFISDCTPDISTLVETLVAKSRFTIVKLSPMLDWHKAVEEINQKGDFVREVHIVAVKNECKELLFVLGKGIGEDAIKITCVNDETVFSYMKDEESVASQRILKDPLDSGMYLYEPNSALMKAGCFAQITRQYGVQAIASNSHLFVSRQQIHDFPGRKFQITSISSLNKKELKASLQNITQANITIRNFPMSVQELRKRLKLKDGGDTYIFATTTHQAEKCLLIGKKWG